MEEVKQTVEMTAEERQEYEAFKAAQAEKKPGNRPNATAKPTRTW